METKHAVVKDGKVVNIIVTGNLTTILPEWVLADDSVFIGSSYGNGVFTSSVIEPEPTLPPTMPLTNINITNAQLVGSIYWIAENTAMAITGNVSLPDGDYMMIAERVVDASQVVDDARFMATVASGVMTINATFKSTGNYLISADRLNRGLDRINAGFHLSFDKIEFDVFS